MYTFTCTGTCTLCTCTPLAHIIVSKMCTNFMYIRTCTVHDRMTVGASLTLGQLHTFLLAKWQLSHAGAGEESDGSRCAKSPQLKLYHTHTGSQTLVKHFPSTSPELDPAISFSTACTSTYTMIVHVIHCIHVYMHVYMYLYVHVIACTCICMHTHWYIQCKSTCMFRGMYESLQMTGCVRVRQT